MDFRTILACLTDVETASATLDAAFLVAGDFKARLDVMHVRPDPAGSVPLIGEGMSGAMVEEMLAAADRHGLELGRALRAKYDEAAGRNQVASAWREEVGREDDIVAAAGRLTDLVILARPRADRDLPSPVTVNAAILDTGRPLLLAPPDPPAHIGRNVAVFWNGSPQAARAVAFALGFLSRAERVTVLAAREEQSPPPEGLVDYLRRHDISAAARLFTAGAPGGGDVGRGLLADAGSEGADLVVMGAYTHSRLRQLILGGVTRHVLGAATIPVLLCR